jgi:hypothetical protein
MFEFLKVKNTLRKHWFDSTNLQMAKTMHQIFIKLTKVIMSKARYFIVNYDEVSTIDIQSWCSVHVYVIASFKKMPLLLNRERVVGGGCINNLITLILKSLMEYGFNN